MDGDDDAAGGRAPALELRAISKRFGATLALDQVSLELAAGETLGLLGQNGSGKSTLVGILAGYHVPERGGEARLAGRPAAFPISRAEHGLSFVFQDLGLANGLSVLENLSMWKRSAGGTGRWRIDWRAERREAEATLSRYGLAVPIRAKVATLSMLDQAMLAIVRSAEELRRYREAGHGGGEGVLVLDEPTVFLPTREKAFLFELIRRVAAEGSGIILVSHDLGAVREVADRVVVLRDGRLVGAAPVAEATDERLARLILGTGEAAPAPEADPARPAPRVPPSLSGGGARPDAPRALAVRDVRGGRVAGASFEVGRGEVVGVAGLIGSGVEDLPALLFGALRKASGELELDGERHDLAHLTPTACVRLRIGFVPADRKRDGILEASAIWENGQLLVLGDHERRGVLRRGRLLRDGARQVRELDVRPADPRARAGALSGGNQQKVLLAKWLEIGPRLLVLHEPTQGVDVGARAEIVELVRARTREGMAVVWVTSDFEELARVCDRVLVMRHGEIVDELRPEGAGPAARLTKERIDRAVLALGEEAGAGGRAAPAGAKEAQR